MKNILLILTTAFVCACQDKDPKRIPATSTTDSIKRDTSEKAKIGTFTTRYNFDSFHVTIYKGKLAAPNFSKNPFAGDSLYVNFITKGCSSNGINFGGHYTIIHKGCGTMCEHIFIVDRINGKIFTDTKPNDGRYGFAYKKDSRLLIANSNSFIDESFTRYATVFDTPELYKWTGTDFLQLK